MPQTKRHHISCAIQPPENLASIYWLVLVTDHPFLYLLFGAAPPRMLVAHQSVHIHGVGWGGVCPARAWRATFVVTSPTLTPDLPSPRGAPQVDQSGPQTFPTQHARQNGQFQHQCVLLMFWLVNNLFPTSAGINTFIIIMLSALTTSYDGGALLTTQGTHICLILSLILHGGQVAYICPNQSNSTCPSYKRPNTFACTQSPVDLQSSST